MGKGFKELLVWQKARELAIDVYKITTHGNFKRDYGLSDQMRRSSVSVPSNIAGTAPEELGKCSMYMR